MASIDVERVRPAGGKRSSKRDFIVDAFLRQEGHLSADDLVDLIRKEDRGISRATVYRTLQWMMDAGIARKVDFGEGRFRFEHSYRHPRHFHLICKTCNQSFEFLSSDIEALIEESGGDGDQVFESNGVKLYVDPISIRYLKGAEVDFVDTVTGGGFTIKNPNATSTCGCGSSFTTEEGGGEHHGHSH